MLGFSPLASEPLGTSTEVASGPTYTDTLTTATLTSTAGAIVAAFAIGLSGAAFTSTAGDVAFVQSYVIGLDGAAYTSTAGTLDLITGYVLPLTGDSITSAAGSVDILVTQRLPLTGDAYTLTAGNVSITRVGAYNGFSNFGAGVAAESRGVSIAIRTNGAGVLT
jgi:hypothetical protein